MIQSKRFSIAASVLGSAGSVLALGLTLSSTPAYAANFSFTTKDVLDTCAFSSSGASKGVGPTSCNNVQGFFDLTASPSGDHLFYKDNGSGSGIGVVQTTQSTDVSRGEIGLGEALNVAFNGGKSAGILSKLNLSLLFDPFSNTGDIVRETAIVTADGTTLKGTLKVNARPDAGVTPTATWTSSVGAPSILTVIKAKAGSYEISNPFGNFKIVGFSLTRPAGELNDAKYSDFVLSGATVTSVPEPGTIAGLGLVGLLAASRRRRTVKAS